MTDQSEEQRAAEKVLDEAACEYSRECHDKFKGLDLMPRLDGFKAGARWHSARVAEAVACVADARETCALMAEGEGPNPQDYMDMALGAMKKLDAALAVLKSEGK